MTIENINWHLEQGKEVDASIMDGAAQIVTPAFVSLLCICIVFVPMFFLPGVARFLFVPMAEAVMAAMICSFILSRTLVPTMANYLLRKHAPHTDMHGLDGPLPRSRNPLVRFQRGFEAGFERVRLVYRELLEMALRRRALFAAGFLAFVFASFALVPFLGRDFFPSVDAGQILMHARTQIGTRVEDTSRQFAEIQKAIRQIIPPEDLGTLVDNVGMPGSGINMTYNSTGTIGTQDGDIQIKLKENHKPTAGYIRILREELPLRFPGVTFSFLPADIISQILNFGAPAPIDLQVRGPNLAANYAYAQQLLRRLRHIPGLVDARIQQSLNNPGFNVDVDRTRAQYVGVTERDVTNSMVVNLAGSSQVAPTYWLNPDNGVSYPIVMQTPQYQVDTLSALKNLPITASGAPSQTLGAIADINRVARSAVVSQYNIQSMVQIYATTQGRDLGAVAADVQKVVDEFAQRSPEERAGCPGRAGPDDEQCILGPAVRTARRDRADLSADRGQLPVLERSVRHYYRAAGGAGRYRLDAVRNGHHPLGPVADRCDHVHGRRHRQQRAGHQLCTRASCRTRRSGPGRDPSGLRPLSPRPR